MLQKSRPSILRKVYASEPQLYDMNAESVLEAIGKHMDALEIITQWALFFALAVGWAGLQKMEITALGRTFSRKQAFQAAGSIYVAASLVILFLFWRLGSLLALVGDGDSVQKAITRIAIHPWLMNPFSFFGSHPFFNSLGYACLIFLWWVCTASLSTLTESLKSRSSFILLMFFLMVGVMIVLAVNRVGCTISDKSQKIDIALYNSFAPQGMERVIAPIAGAVLGIVAFAGMNVWIRRERLNNEIEMKVRTR